MAPGWRSPGMRMTITLTTKRDLDGAKLDIDKARRLGYTGK